jgi:hypothetical protein
MLGRGRVGWVSGFCGGKMRRNKTGDNDVMCGDDNKSPLELFINRP